jgi:hypothetical protein
MCGAAESVVDRFADTFERDRCDSYTRAGIRIGGVKQVEQLRGRFDEVS